jgi:hypothetical protein
MDRTIDHEYATILPVRTSTRVINTLALAIALYAFACWVYVAAVALVLPNTLPWQLTHFAHWPRTDTFGEVSFLVSFVAFIAYRLTMTDARR